MEIKTTQYVFSHGRAPRGRGCWAFSFSPVVDAPWFAPGDLTYSEAKKLAIAEARMRNASTVEVLP